MMAKGVGHEDHDDFGKECDDDDNSGKESEAVECELQID